MFMLFPEMPIFEKTTLMKNFLPEPGKYGKRILWGTALTTLTWLGCDMGPGLKASAGGAAREDEDSDQDPERIRKLNAQSEWRALKAVWKYLDAVEPGKDADSLTAYTPYFYSGSDNYEKCWQTSDSLSKIMGQIEPGLYRLTQEKLADSAEIEILLKVIHGRIEYIYTGFRSMMMRMMPPPGQVEREQRIVDLEFRIDRIRRLQKSGALDEEEAKLALDIVMDDLKTYEALDILGSSSPSFLYHGMLYRESENDTIPVFTRAVNEFDRQRRSFLESYRPEKADEAQKQTYLAYEKAHRELAGLNALQPSLRELLHDLMFND